MPISAYKIAAFQKIIAALPDKPNASAGMTAAQLKAWFDSSPEELRLSVNSLIDGLLATTDGTSGADQIGATLVAGIAGETVQAILESLKAYTDAQIATGVSLSGDQTVAGVKTFTSSPVIPEPTADTQAATKKYVDDKDALDVKLSGDQTIGGVKDFTSSPTVPTPTSDLQAVNKGYTDAGLALKADQTTTYTKSETYSRIEVDDKDGQNVKLSDAQTVAGVKSFTDSPLVPTPTLDTQAANRGYVEAQIAGVVAGTFPPFIAEYLPVADTGGYYTADNVEAIFQEIALQMLTDIDGGTFGDTRTEPEIDGGVW